MQLYCVYFTQAEHRSEKTVKVESSTSGNSEEALRHFHVPDDKMPLIFRLMKVQGLPEWANTSCVSVDDVIKVILWLEALRFLGSSCLVFSIFNSYA